MAQKIANHPFIGCFSKMHRSKDKTEWLPILAYHLEFNRVQINAVQSGWDKPHPLYKSVLEDLLAIYESWGIKQKQSKCANSWLN